MGITAVAPNEPQVETCRHHWVIAAPEGALSLGRCKVCGEEREFHNSSADSMWEPEGSQGAASWGRRTATLPTAPVDDGF